MFNFKNENHEWILFLDTEFDQLELIQFAGLLFRRVEDELYVPYRSLNIYIQKPVTLPFTRYTGISSKFLEHTGVSLDDARWQIDEHLLRGVSGDLLLVSHGLHSDLTILDHNKITLPHAAEYCTFEKAKGILNRQTQLSLEDLAREACIYPAGDHNAYMDAWLTVGVYDYLKNLED